MLTVREYLFKGFGGCTDHGCIVKGEQKGMGTNGGCRCLVDLNQTQLIILGSRLRAVGVLDNIWVDAKPDDVMQEIE
jgi:hypothetical protein